MIGHVAPLLAALLLAGAACAQPLDEAAIDALLVRGLRGQAVVDALAGRPLAKLNAAARARLSTRGAGDRLIAWLRWRVGGELDKAFLPYAPGEAVPAWPRGPGFGGKRRALTIADVIKAHVNDDEDAIGLIEMIADSTRELVPTPLDQAALLKARVPLSVRALLDGRQLTIAGLVELVQAGVARDEVLDLITLLGVSGRPTSAQALPLLRGGFAAEDLRELRAGEHDHPPVPYARGGRPGAPLAFMQARKPTPAVAKALTWLAAVQWHDGRWDSGGEQPTALKALGGVGKLRDLAPGATGLALLAFLGAGHGPDSATYGRTVRRGLGYLLREQQTDGLIGAQEGRSLTRHAVACLALCEAYGISGDPRLGGAARLALAFLLRGQDSDGGWRYRPGAGSDVASTSWATQALVAGLLSGCAPGQTSAALAKASTYVEQLTNNEGVTGYRKAPRAGFQRETSDRLVDAGLDLDMLKTHGRSHAPTAAALAVRALAGRISAAEARRGIKRMTIGDFSWNPPTRNARGTVDCMLAYHGARAIWHLDSRAGQAWSKQLRAALGASQLTKGALAGSWDPAEDAWGPATGRAVITAINALTLLTETRYPQQVQIPQER